MRQLPLNTAAAAAHCRRPRRHPTRVAPVHTLASAWLHCAVCLRGARAARNAPGRAWCSAAAGASAAPGATATAAAAATGAADEQPTAAYVHLPFCKARPCDLPRLRCRRSTARLLAAARWRAAPLAPTHPPAPIRRHCAEQVRLLRLPSHCCGPGRHAGGALAGPDGAIRGAGGAGGRGQPGAG